MPILIDGLSPTEYATLWGDESADGGLLYNYGSEQQEYTAEYLTALLAAIDRTIEKVKGWLKSINAEVPQDNNRRMVRLAYEEDLRNLPLLREHVAAELADVSR